MGREIYIFVRGLHKKRNTIDTDDSVNVLRTMLDSPTLTDCERDALYTAIAWGTYLRNVNKEEVTHGVRSQS